MYGDLLEVFWHSHNPIHQQWSSQYKSVIFYHNDGQKRQATETKDRLQAETGREIYTGIVPAGTFYLAEDYHQKYYLQQFHELTDEFRAIYPDINDFVNSTAVTRVNGYAGGYGTTETLHKEMESLGLSPEGINRVLNIAERGLAPACPVF